MSILDKPGIIVLDTEPKDPNGKYPYKAILQRNHEYKGFDGAWILIIVGIYPGGPSSTPGQWYLDTLLGYDGYGSGRRSDFIYIDHGQNWGVGNMLAVLKEAEETVYGKMDESLDEEFIDKYAHIPMRMRNWYQKPENQPGYEDPKKVKTPKKKKPSQKIIEKKWDIEGEIQDLKNSLRSLRRDSQDRDNEAEQFSSDIIERYGWEFMDMLNSGLSKEDKLRAIEKWSVEQDEKHKVINNPESILREYDYYYDQKHEEEEEDLEKQIETKENELEELYNNYDF